MAEYCSFLGKWNRCSTNLRGKKWLPLSPVPSVGSKSIGKRR